MIPWIAGTVVALFVVFWPHLPWRRRRILLQLREALSTPRHEVLGRELGDFVTLAIMEDDCLIERHRESDGRTSFKITSHGILRSCRRWP